MSSTSSATWGVLWTAARPKPFVGLRLYLSWIDRWGCVADIPETKGCGKDEWPVATDKDGITSYCYRPDIHNNAKQYYFPGEINCPNDPAIVLKQWTPGDVIWSKLRNGNFDGWAKLRLTANTGLCDVLPGTSHNLSHISQVAIEEDRIFKSVIYVPCEQVKEKVTSTYCNCRNPSVKLVHISPAISYNFCDICKKEKV